MSDSTTPQDGKAMPPASAGSVADGSDIVERLRVYAVQSFALPVADLVDCAADEIERLRPTRDEREAMELAAAYAESVGEDGVAQDIRRYLDRSQQKEARRER